MKIHLFALPLILLAQTTHAQNCLEIQDYKTMIDAACSAYQLSSSYEMEEIKGKVDAETASLIKKTILDFEGAVDIHLVDEDSDNVRQIDLPEELKSIRSCKRTLTEKFMPMMCAYQGTKN